MPAGFSIGSITLEALDVGGNSIGDEGVSLLIKGLKDNKVLGYLGVDDCQLSVKGQKIQVCAFATCDMQVFAALQHF